MQLDTIAARPATTPAPAPVPVDASGFGIAEVKRGFLAHPVSLVLGDRHGFFASLDDALSAAKQLSAGDKPAAAVWENRYIENGNGAGGVPADQHFSVYDVAFQEWKGERGGQLINSGPYHHGEFSRTKGYELTNDPYSDDSPHEATVLVDGDLTWDNGIAPTT